MSVRPFRLLPVLLVLLVFCAAAPALALQPPGRASRFDRLAVDDPSWSIGTVAEPSDEPGWAELSRSTGAGLRVHVDRRTGSPTLAEGAGIRWMSAEQMRGADRKDMESRARDLVRANEQLFRIRDAELVLNPASGPMDADHWVLVFDRRVDGIPVEDQRFILYVTRGNLTAFGADRWGAVVPVESRYSSDLARELLYAHMGITAADAVLEVEPPTEVYVPARVGPPGRWAGNVGEGVAFHRAHRFVLRVEGERGTWVGKVDAATGAVIALYDDNKYEQVKGGVFPVSDDGICPDGCEQPGWPMPYADVTLNGNPTTANDMGLFDCSPFGGTAVTTLAGPYVRVQDNCGPINQSVTCAEDLDLQQGPGTDCVVPAGSSLGNTHASRSGFYHLNRVMEKGRAWLPTNTWLQSQLVDNVNINSTCNAYWNGSVNFYKSGGGCRNTGEIAGVFVHEWGHGIDQNDGGGYDNPSEAYADIVAFLQTHVSCIGRGFFVSDQCSGYGNACLDCTGIRDQDWDMRANHTPSTPTGFIQNNCGGGSGPCGKETHCEGYLAGETVWDLAVRDLPASGLDADTAWQLADKLFYKSRQGSGGNAYNCSLPSSDGCGAGSWFTKFRTIDDDDGNLNNGTPHAAAIFAAFDRHKIACGAVNDASNQSSSSCPSLAAPSLTATAGSNAVSLSWSAVTGASSYLILRNDQGCSAGYTIVATVPAPTTSYTDSDLPNDFTVYYRVQAQGANQACESAVSNCASAAPQPFAGSIRFGQATYACASTMQITVTDANVGASTTTAEVFSPSEPTPETVVLTETAPGSSKYLGTIAATSGPSGHGDGAVRIAHADTITAQYVDANDGQGGTNLLRVATATGDCLAPVITQVGTKDVTDVAAKVTWVTGEGANSHLTWGPLVPPANVKTDPQAVTSHTIPLTGLQACTVYYFKVQSADPAGNVAVDDAAGQYHHFETLGNLGNGLQSCHGGRVTLQQGVVSCNSSLGFTVTDLDLNLSSTAVDTATITVTSTTETTPETVTVVETGPNTSRFTASIPTSPGPAIPGDGILQASHSDVLTATYRDADDGTGAPAISFDTAAADCAAPGVNTVQVMSITDENARIQWSTTESTTGRVDWGLTPALGNVAVDSALNVSHLVLLSPIPECGRVYFRITTTDAYGHSRVIDDNGQPFAFNANQIGGVVFKDDFESATGWQLAGEWQIAGPQGKGTAPADPAAAFSGTKVLGHDLTGLGSRPGDYELAVTERAISPAINATNMSNGQLKFRRWLNVGGGGIAAIYIRSNNVTGPAVWTSTSVSQSGWSLETINLEQGNGSGDVRVIFEMKGGSGTTGRSSWNIDRFVLRNGTAPEFDACGGCGGTPTFAGAATARDAAPCADTGITLTWSAAPAWGTGHAGSYAVYRSTTPGFAPSASNRIAAGVRATSYVDATAPNGVTLHYLVRAENDETCSTGPANGGTTDANLAYVSAMDTTTQVLPGSVDGVAASPVNKAHVRLTWPAVPDAVDYRIYRGSTPQGPFEVVGATSSLFFEDLEQMGNATSWYYLVRAADSCGNVGP